MSKLMYRMAVVALTMQMLLSTAKSEQKSQRIVATDETGLTVEFEVANWSLKDYSVNGEVMTRLSFPEASYKGQEGKPAIPYHVAVIGVPAGAEVRARVMNVQSKQQTDFRLLPGASYKSIDGDLIPDFVPEQTVYASPQVFPVQMVEVIKMGSLRDQQIVQIQVAAAKVWPKQKRLERFDKVTVRIDFVGGQIQAGSASTAHRSYSQNEEDLFKSQLNYGQARRWRQTSGPQPLRKSATIEPTLYSFKISEEGLYKISGATLLQQVAGLDLLDVDPARIRLYNNGGKEVARNLRTPRPDGPVENAIIVNDGGDGRFDRDDYILFYGRGVEGWDFDGSQTGAARFRHYINHYARENVYLLTLSGAAPGARMTTSTSGAAQPSVVERYQGLYFLEQELQNPIRSGLNWFGRLFSVVDDFGNAFSWTATLPNLVPNELTQLKLRFLAENGAVHYFRTLANQNELAMSSLTGVAPTASGGYLQMRVGDYAYDISGLLSEGENDFRIEYSHSQGSGQAHLDWMEVLYSAQLNAIDNQLFFTVVPSNASESYRVGNFSGNSISVFDVTDYANVVQVLGAEQSGDQLTFTQADSVGQYRRYAVLDESSYRSISELDRIDIEDLRAQREGAEFIIITHDDFAAQASTLKSHRENNSADPLTTATVKISDIYANFSSGVMDPLAIRDFLKFAYDNWTVKPLYVLLFGDGDYDYKNITIRTDQNWIPTFQTDVVGDDNGRQINQLTSRTIDAAFTYLNEDDYELSGNHLRPPSAPTMDLAIGRLTVQTVSEAQAVVDKIIAYESQPAYDNWRNIITVIGDDELIAGGRPSASDDVHLNQAEQIADAFIPPTFDVKKIYLPEFPEVRSAAAGGISKPLAKEALINQMNQGTLLVNFIGHGNSTLWAHERVFTQVDDDRIQNQGKPIFFVAATCDWALFDDPLRQSQAEDLLLMQDRGAIAIISSARLVYAHENFSFSRNYYTELFRPSVGSERIGVAFMKARMSSNIERRVNDEKYHVYGDPTLRLAMPQLKAQITSLAPDSIWALSKMEIQGEVLDANDQLMANFNGKALLTTFDSEKTVVRQPKAGTWQPYNLPGNSIFRGTVPVTNGRFKAEFIVPKDISYGGGQARVSAYVWSDEQGIDGSGYRNNILVSSSASPGIVDSEGPQIKIYFKDQPGFSSGDLVADNTTLVVELADTLSGINIAGEIGHKLTLTIDPDEETCLSELNRFNGVRSTDLTDLFRFEEGDYLRGKIEFPIQFPEQVDIAGKKVSCVPLSGEQQHTLVVKGWDNSNNSTSASVDVRVVHADGLVLEEVMNYPNPFKKNTTFTFVTNLASDIIIKIYTVSGQLIKTMEYPNADSGFNMLEWDGLDEQGDAPANGVYLYKLTARGQSEDGPVQDEIVGRLAIIR